MMKKFKNVLVAVGAVTVATGVIVALKKLYDDYRHFVDYEVDDIALDDAPKLYAESRLDSLKEKLERGTKVNPVDESETSEEDDTDLDEDEIWDDEEYDAIKFDEDDEIEGDGEDDVELVLDEDEEDYISDEDESETHVKSDFEKVCGVTREEAIKLILAQNKSHSKELLDVLEDASLAEIYTSLK